MTNIEFRKLLSEIFKSHSLMWSRKHHTVNELLHLLRYDNRLSDLTDVNISILTVDNRCICIPCLDAFVDIGTLGIWFNDSEVEFEIDEFEYEGKIIKTNNITVWEREEE